VIVIARFIAKLIMSIVIIMPTANMRGYFALVVLSVLVTRILGLAPARTGTARHTRLRLVRILIIIAASARTSARISSSTWQHRLLEQQRGHRTRVVVRLMADRQRLDYIRRTISIMRSRFGLLARDPARAGAASRLALFIGRLSDVGCGLILDCGRLIVGFVRATTDARTACRRTGAARNNRLAAASPCRSTAGLTIGLVARIASSLACCLIVRIDMRLLENRSRALLHLQRKRGASRTRAAHDATPDSAPAHRSLGRLRRGRFAACCVC
jgi:hypothetical protein